MENSLMELDALPWGVPVLVLLSAVELLYTVKTRLFQFRHFKHIIKNTAEKIFEKSTAKGDGALTPLQAISSALVDCAGTGNISGVATAIFANGPDAIFWMWVISLFSMLTKCVEVTLTQYYRVRREDGVYYGSSIHYIEREMECKWKSLAVFFAITIIVGGLRTAAFVQPFVMSNTMNNAFWIPIWIVIVVMALICDMIFVNGVSGVGEFCGKIVLVMCLVCIISVVGIILTHSPQTPQALTTTFTRTFTPLSATGGLASSTATITIKQGTTRDTFSDEAGYGTFSIIHATAISPHPFKEGMYDSFEVFTDTLVVCTITALAVMRSGPKIWQSGLGDVTLTQSVFSITYGSIGPATVSVCLCLFTLSTMVGWEINYESAFSYISPKASGSNAVKLLIRLMWLIPGFTFLGKISELMRIVMDIVSGLWCIPNTVAPLFLPGTFMKMYNDYGEKCILKTGPLTDKLDQYSRGKGTFS